MTVSAPRPATLTALARAFGGDPYAGGRRALVPAPGHSAADRSVSLLLEDGRVVAHSFGGADWREVLDELRARGWIDADNRLLEGGAPVAARGAAAPERTRAERITAARALWAGAGPVLPGSPAAAYIAARAVAGELVSPMALRAHPAVPLGVYRDRGPRLVALLAAVIAPDGEVTAVEVTYIDARGRPSRMARPPRKIVGVVSPGSAVRLAEPRAEMLVGEGVFTTLSAMARFGLPGWALLSTGNLRRWTAPVGVERVLIAGDRGPDGERSGWKLCRALRGGGVVADIQFPPAGGGDWNDLARREGEEEGRLGRPDRRDCPARPGGKHPMSATSSRRKPVEIASALDETTVTATPVAEPTAPRVAKVFALRDLDVAPENMRFGEPPDDGVAELAETIFAAGVLQPLTARPGRGKKERPGMALDGRRRLLALWRLRDVGRITDDYPVEAFVETDPARQAAAIVLTNTALPVHVADVVVAIGKMLKARLTPTVIAGALGYAEVDVRRLAALAELHPKAIEALRGGRITLRQARLLARLPDRKEQGEIAQAAMSGFGFQEWRVTNRLDDGQVTVRDRRFKLVGPERYGAAGGRIESDLFGERPDVVLDPEALQAAWTARAEALAADLRTEGLTVIVAVEPAEIDDPALEPFGDAYGHGLDAEGLAAWDQAQDAAQETEAALVDRDFAAEDADPAIAAHLCARLACDLAGEPVRDVTLIQIFADTATGLDLRAYGPPAPAPAIGGEVDVEDDGEGDEADEAFGVGQNFEVVGRPSSSVTAVPVAVAPSPELEGVNHALHEVRTDVATRALIRALADDPAAALVAVIARLFGVLVLHQGRGRGGGALSLEAEAYGRVRVSPIEALDGDVRRRLAERRATWQAAALSPIAWVSSLPHGEKMALLAELVALSLDLREERTSSVRRTTRAEAVEIAALCQADVTLHWTPDAGFLGAHPKSKLLDMLDDMGAGETRAGGCRKDELVALVAERAAERGWAPAYLSWSAEPPEEAEDEASAVVDAEPASGVDDGAQPIAA